MAEDGHGGAITVIATIWLVSLLPFRFLQP